MITCILCRGHVVSDIEDVEVKYESHLMEWHNIAVDEERKLAIYRTREKQLATELYVKGKISVDGDELDEKIKTTRKTILAVEHLIVIENENYTAVRNKVINNEETFPMLSDYNQNIPTVSEDNVNNEIRSEVTEKVNGDKLGKDMLITTVLDVDLVDQMDYEEVPTADQQIVLELPYSLNAEDIYRSERSPGSSIAFSEDGAINDDSKDVKDCSVKMMKLKKNVITHMVERMEGDISVPWYEWGNYVCLLCGSFVFLGSMERHLHINHSMSLDTYQEQHKEDMSIPLYKCLVCGISVSHTLKKILSHLQLHNMDMASYYFQHVNAFREFGEKEKVEIKERVFKKEMENSRTEKNYDEYDIDQVKTSPTIIISNKLFKRCKRKIQPFHSSPFSKQEAATAVQAHFPAESSTSAPAAATSKMRRQCSSTDLIEKSPWYDSSWHQCLECLKMNSRSKFFTSHVKEHKMNKKQYLEKYPAEKFEKVPNWNCELCCKKISWSARSIVSHLTKVHSMSKDQYAILYINKPEEVKESDREHVVFANDEIMLEGEPQIQKLDTTQDITEVLGILGVDL